jgi:hypothetical protein
MSGYTEGAGSQVDKARAQQTLRQGELNLGGRFPGFEVDALPTTLGDLGWLWAGTEATEQDR